MSHGFYVGIRVLSKIEYHIKKEIFEVQIKYISLLILFIVLLLFPLKSS